MTGRLAWAEAERLPFDDGTFDACYSVGGFNYFRDHAAALREMRRVHARRRPGGRRRRDPRPPSRGHRPPDRRCPAIDALLAAAARARPRVRRHGPAATTSTSAPSPSRVWPDATTLPIWNRLGYCLVHPDPIHVLELADDLRRGASHEHACPSQCTSRPRPGPADLEPLRCPSCAGRPCRVAACGLACDGCGAAYPVRDGVLVVKEQDRRQQPGRPGLLRQPALAQVPVLGVVHLVLQRRRARARNQVLRHLPQQPGLKLLDVAIGDGVYLAWLPDDWRIVGVDISGRSSRPAAPRAAGRRLRLILGEAETLPFRDDQFDAVLSIGGFNYFNDPEGALREMARVARPGATIVISDEMPNLTDRMLGHKLGLPALDRWIVSRLMHLGDRFTDMVERHRDLDVRRSPRVSCPTSSTTRSGAAGLRPGRASPGDRSADVVQVLGSPRCPMRSSHLSISPESSHATHLIRAT